MIGLIVTFFLNRGASPKNARAYAWAILILGAVLLLWGAKALYDKSVVDTHDAKIEASAATADRKADEKAAVQATKDAQRRDFETDQLLKAVQHAPKDPAISDDRERSLAFHRCLRLQQTARANGLKPPACV